MLERGCTRFSLQPQNAAPQEHRAEGSKGPRRPLRRGGVALGWPVIHRRFLLILKPRGELETGIAVYR